MVNSLPRSGPVNIRTLAFALLSLGCLDLEFQSFNNPLVPRGIWYLFQNF